MKTYLFIILCFLVKSEWTSGQGQLVIRDNSYLVIDNLAKLVVANPAQNAIVSFGLGGIITEREFNQVVWKIGTNTGTYTVPFVSELTLTPIPFETNITTAAIGAGEIRFSTYPGSNWNNNTYRPSDVTHMGNLNSNLNNSDHVIDRFWIVDALNYTTKPTSVFSFTYRDSEHLQLGNSIIEANLGAQRFNPGPGLWGDYMPQGATNVIANSTSGVSVSPANFWRSWTLSETAFPLGSDLIYFQSTCDERSILLQWQTLNEINVAAFEIEFVNENSVSTLATISANGGGFTTNYAYTIPNEGRGVLRLIEIDMNGEREVKNYLPIDCASAIEDYVSFQNESNTLILAFEAYDQGIEDLNIFDASGRLIFQSAIPVEKGENKISLPLPTISLGVYYVKLKNGNSYLQNQFVKI